MKVVIDNNIPFIKGMLEPFARVKYLLGSEISNKDIIDTDALIIRTRTKANSMLLKNTGLKFIGTTTIGTDHIDTKYCLEKGIYCASAPGCNSGSVMQYIASALAELQLKKGIKSDQTSLGIIGVGNVGKKVARLAETLGYRVLLNDPPRERKEGGSEFTSLDRLVQESDIITVHVPLTREGEDKTYKLIDKSAFEKVKKGVIFINTSRGGVIDESLLLKKLRSGAVKAGIIDVWENEPVINRDLLEHTFLATPHIAGYSVDGKLNGATTILDEFSRFFALPINQDIRSKVPLAGDMLIDIDKFHGSLMDKVYKAILHTYQISEDHDSFSASPDKFEELRNNYGIRREFHNYTVLGSSSPALEILARLGFKTRIH